MADSFNVVSAVRSRVTRAAVREGFERFVDDAIDATADHFSVSRALRQGVRGPGASVVDRLLKNSDTVRRRVVEPELRTYRRRTITQFDAILDYAESDADVETFAEEIMRHDAFVDSIRSDVPAERRRAVLDSLLDRHRRLGDATMPLIEAAEDDFWAAATATLDREAAERLVEERFAFVEPIRGHTDVIAMTTRVDPAEILGGIGGLLGGSLPTIDVEYTDEAVRAMTRAEQSVIADAKREIDRRFD